MIPSAPRPRILLAEPLDHEAETALEAAAEVIRPPDVASSSGRHSRAADPGFSRLAPLLSDCDALIVRTHTPVTRDLLEAGRRLRVVGVAGVGVDRVDLDAARRRGVEIVHTPAASSDAVAELTIALLLQMLRPIPRLAAAYQAGEFHAARARPHGNEVRDQTVGVIGMGRIGSRVGRICAAGFGARVVYHDIAPVGPFDFAAEPLELDALLASSDVVTLHVPLTATTRGMLNGARLARLKPAARLINTARGAAVDLPALTAALRSGVLAGAALDVTDPEPLPPEHELFTLPNCILTPHIAARTHPAMRRMCAVADAVLEALSRTAAL